MGSWHRVLPRGLFRIYGLVLGNLLLLMGGQLAYLWLVPPQKDGTPLLLPEVPLLAVLPGTGGLTRLSDKRKVRRDRADVFCTLEEGIQTLHVNLAALKSAETQTWQPVGAR